MLLSFLLGKSYYASILILFENLFKPRQRRLAVRMITDFVSFICNLKDVL
ncbi:Uncharacterised protein [Streptococcus pneumoniae]|nr:Uncharacterised protein [Streptococcus pneumoniae]